MAKINEVKDSIVAILPSDKGVIVDYYDVFGTYVIIQFPISIRPSTYFKVANKLRHIHGKDVELTPRCSDNNTWDIKIKVE